MLARLLKRVLPPDIVADLREVRSLDRDARRYWVRQRWARLRGARDVRNVPPTTGARPLIVFLCHGNIYRSPMAALLAAREAERIAPSTLRVVSAGLHVNEGRESPPDALTAATERGVALGDHRARPLTPALALEADLLVVMDGANEANLLARHPELSEKIVLLGAFAGDGGPIAIRDPYGKGIDAVRACYRRIARAVDGLLEALLGSGTPVAPRRHSLIVRGARRALASRAMSPLWRPFMRDSATILMLHRFEDPELGVRGHDPAALASHLEYLRANRYHIVSLSDVVERFATGAPVPPRTVVFTVDDGYADFDRIGAPLLARYDCSATVFLVTGFVDGGLWLWYDAVRYLLGDAASGAMEVPVGEITVRLLWSTTAERERVATRLSTALKGFPSDVVDATVTALQERTGRPLPARPVDRFAPMSWAAARHWATRGIGFGPHSHTHPILSRSDEARVRRELEVSMSRLRSELPAPVPIYCYPNGTPSDYGPREQRLVRELGCVAAVAAVGGICDRARYQRNPFALPRIAYEDDAVEFKNLVGGLERAREQMFTVGRS